MKKKPFENLSIRIRFILMIMLELICVSLISWIVMDVLHISDVPYIVWIILASVIAGGVLNNFLSIRYFGPVLKLEKAMHRERLHHQEQGLRAHRRRRPQRDRGRQDRPL